MSAKLLFLYGVPEDSAAFDRHFTDQHVPLVRAVPGLRSASTSVGPIGSPEGPAPYHRVASYAFDSMDELKAGLTSEEGGAAAADLGNFASGGVTVLILDEQEL